MKYKTVKIETENGFQIVDADQAMNMIKENSYRGDVHCPGDNCYALLMPINSTTNYFRAQRREVHIWGCKFGKPKYTGEQIENSLRWHLAHFPASKNTTSGSRNQKQKRKSGESSIPGYYCDDVNELLVGDDITVYGFVCNVKISEDASSPYAWIMFRTNSGISVRAKLQTHLFKEDCNTLDVIQNIKIQNDECPKDNQLVCVCYGEASQGDNGINILVKNLPGLAMAIKPVKEIK